MDFGKVFGPPENFDFKQLYTRTSAEWERSGQRHALKLFHAVATHVPAYKDFLKKHRVNPDKIKTWDDFQHVPIVSKDNYLRKYPLEKLCWEGTLKKPMTFAVTSGSTGKPFYFPRDQVLDRQSSIMHELFLRSSGFDKNKSTLVIVGFGMGVWIGGLITYRAFELLKERAYPINLLTPGVSKREIFQALHDIGSKYRQVILCGYPPFIKDVIDEGKNKGIKWRKFNLRIICAAEPFSESFRDYILQKTGIKNPYSRSMNIYGSADLGTMAEETPLAILVRRLAIQDSRFFRSIFGGIDRLPTLAQFNPLFTNFEALDGEILITAYNTLPLIRYAIGDHGGVISFDELGRRFRSNNIGIKKKSRSILKSLPSRMPFVYVYERSDFSTKLYGAIIYPEPIREALGGHLLARFLTGKFTMLTKFTNAHNEYLEINVELKPRVRESGKLKNLVREQIVKKLIEKNAEYRNNYHAINHKVIPSLKFWVYEHPRHFKPGIKQKWVKK